MKEEIIEKSLELFLKHGLREMSNQKLVEQLGISTKTVYKYFKNKEELLEAVLHLYHSIQYKKLEALPTQQNAASLFFDVWQIALDMEYTINKDFYHDLHYYYPDLEKKVNAIIGGKFERFFISIIHKGIAQQTFRQEISPELALKSVLVLLQTVVRTEEFKNLGLTSTDLLLNMITPYIRGMCTIQGVHALDEHISVSTTSTQSMVFRLKLIKQ
jgi:AcrR family transcriptional regulator